MISKHQQCRLSHGTKTTGQGHSKQHNTSVKASVMHGWGQGQWSEMPPQLIFRTLEKLVISLFTEANIFAAVKTVQLSPLIFLDLANQISFDLTETINLNFAGKFAARKSNKNIPDSHCCYDPFKALPAQNTKKSILRFRSCVGFVNHSLLHQHIQSFFSRYL